MENQEMINALTDAATRCNIKKVLSLVGKVKPENLLNNKALEEAYCKAMMLISD